MEHDRDAIAGAFDIIESHLRAKGHEVRRDDSHGSLHLACAGVLFDHAAEAGTFVSATTAAGQSTVLAALADLDDDAHAEHVDELRGKLARARPITNDTRTGARSYTDVLDCSGCDLPCDLLDGLHHCDLGGCDVPGCDLW
jgi:hypothetical protein